MVTALITVSLTGVYPLAMGRIETVVRHAKNTNTAIHCDIFILTFHPNGRVVFDEFQSEKVTSVTRNFQFKEYLPL